MRARRSLRAALELPGDPFHVAPHAEEVPAPELRDLLLGIAAAHELVGDLEGLGGVVPALDAAAAVEIRADAHMIDPHDLDGVVDVVHEIRHSRRGKPGLDLLALLVEDRAVRLGEAPPPPPPPESPPPSKRF